MVRRLKSLTVRQPLVELTLWQLVMEQIGDRCYDSKLASELHAGLSFLMIIYTLKDNGQGKEEADNGSLFSVKQQVPTMKWTKRSKATSLFRLFGSDTQRIEDMFEFCHC